MSSIHQHYLNSLAKFSVINSLNSEKDWLSKSSFVLVLATAALAMSGCQSNNGMTQSAATASINPMIDFTTVDATKIKAQGQAFNQNLKDNDQRYQQLFDQNSFPNSDSQAKRHLMTAIRQHLASEHVAVARANYNAVPFIDADSIDSGSTGLLRTILEVYAYRETVQYDDDVASAEADVAEAMAELEAAGNGNAEYLNALDRLKAANVDTDDLEALAALDDMNEAVLAANTAVDYTSDSAFEVAYSKDGYDYDQDGYDIDGYDEQGYDRSGYDYDGYDEYGESKTDFGSESDNTSDSTNYSLRERIADNNPKEFLASYEEMQLAKQIKKNSANIQPTNPFATNSPSVLSLILNMLHKTPEQVAAANLYQYKYLTFNSVSQYLPKQRQFNSVYSYDYAAPTISSSVQLPIAFNFNTSKMTIDPAAIMPIVAIANPENTPLQMTAHTVDFGLPETITSQLPAAVIYDAAINAMQASMAELAPEHFSAVDIREDSFAKQVGASRAIKVYFGSKQTGEIIGKMFKYMSQSLQQYVDANPTQYPDGALLKTAIEKIQLYNKGYQSADIGALLQLVEAVVPISFNQVNYYYLDSSDKLLAKQQRINIGGDLMGSNTRIVNEIRYDRNSFAKNALTPLLVQSFGADAKPAIDGNAWLAAQRQQKQRLDAARSARYSYKYGDSDYYESTQEDATDSVMEADATVGLDYNNETGDEATDYAGE